MFKRLIISTLLLCVFTISLATHAQAAEVTAAAVFSFAAVIDNQIWVYQPGIAPVQITTPDVQGIPYLRWSADGRYLAYIAYTGDNRSQLWVTSADNQFNSLIAEDMNTGYPVAFTPTGGGRIIYTQFSLDSKQDSGIYKIAIYSAPIQGRGPVIQLGTFDYGAGCGGGSIIPADWVYSLETHSLGGFYETLEVTPFGILHSVDCGGDQTALLNPDTGTDTLLNDHFGRVKVSQDGTKAAGIALNVSTDANDAVIRNWRVLVIDLATNQVTEIPTESEPQQLAWSADGQSVFYSTRSVSGDLYQALSAADRATLDQAMGFSIGTLETYTVSIWQVELATQTGTQIYSADAYAIGRMIALPDSSGLIFSQIPNLNAWVSGLLNGSINFSGDPSVQNDTVQPEVYTLNLTDHQISMVGSNLRQITLPG